MSQRKAFTLVELLVVIGIIAVLISILLPTLGRARAAAQTVSCASNARQLALAIRLFSQEHRGYMPTAADTKWAWQRDPSRQIWVYRSKTAPAVVLDWASSLLPYLGARNVEWFIDAGDKSKVFLCPSDGTQDYPGTYNTAGGPGLKIYNNIFPQDNYLPISYGINADIGSLVGDDGEGHCGPGDTTNIYGGPPSKTGKGLPMGAKLDKVQRSAEVLLIGDCGTRPPLFSAPPTPLDRNEALFYTSNWMSTPTVLQADLGRLSGVVKTSWLKDRVPWKRHRDKINIAFCDGHGETILKGDEQHVRVSPWK